MQASGSHLFSWEPIDDKTHHNFRNISLLPFLASKGLVSGVWSSRAHIIAVSADRRSLISFDAISQPTKPVGDKDFEAVAAFFSAASEESAIPVGGLSYRLHSPLLHLCCYKANSRRLLIACTEAGVAHGWTWLHSESRWLPAGSVAFSGGLSVSAATFTDVCEGHFGIVWIDPDSCALMATPVSSQDLTTNPRLVTGNPTVLGYDLSPSSQLHSAHDGVWIFSPRGVNYWGRSSEDVPELIGVESVPPTDATLIPWTGELFIVHPEQSCLLRPRRTPGLVSIGSRQLRIPAGCDKVSSTSHFLLCFSADAVHVYDARSLSFVSTAPSVDFSWCSRSLSPGESDILLVFSPSRGIVRLRIPLLAESSRRTPNASAGNVSVSLDSSGSALLQHLERLTKLPDHDTNHQRNLIFSRATELFGSPALPSAAVAAPVSDDHNLPAVTNSFLRESLSPFLASLESSYRGTLPHSRHATDSTAFDEQKSFNSPSANSRGDASLQNASQLNLAMLPALKRFFSALTAPDCAEVPHPANHPQSRNDVQFLRFRVDLLDRMERLAGVDRANLERLAQQADHSSFCLPSPSNAGIVTSSMLYNQFVEDGGAQALLFETMCQLYLATAPHLFVTFVDMVQLNAIDRDASEAISIPTSEAAPRRPLSALLSAGPVSRPKEHAQNVGSQSSSTFASSSMRDMAAVLDAAGHLEPAPYTPPRLTFYNRALSCLASVSVESESREFLVARVSLLDRVGRFASALRLILSSRLAKYDADQVWGAAVSYAKSKFGDDPIRQPESAELVTILFQAAFVDTDLSTGRDRVGQVLSTLPAKLSAIDLVGLLKASVQSHVVPLGSMKSRILQLVSAEVGTCSTGGHSVSGRVELMESAIN